MPPNWEKTPDIQLDDLNKQKQELEKQINDLKAQVLDEQEKQLQLSKLESEKQKIQDQILQLSNDQQNSLKQDIEKSHNPNPQALEIIKQSWLYTKLQETFQDPWIYPELNWNIDAKIDKFSNQISHTIDNYLQSIFMPMWSKNFPPTALASINTWIQFMLMDTLKNTNNGADFFSSFSKINVDDGFKNLFQWALKTFAKWWEFLSVWKKITKTIDFLSLQPSLRDNAHQIPQLMNPYEFIQFTNNPQILSSKDLSKLSLADLWIQAWWDINMTDDQKEYLDNIATNAAIKNDPETIKAIISSLQKADWFLQKRKDLSQSALDLMDQADWMIKPFQKLLWIDMFDMLKPFKWVLNMILSLLWFAWWLDGLQRKRLSRKIDWQLDTQDKKDFMSDSMDYFQKNILNSKVSMSDSDSCIYRFGLWSLASDIQSKIPFDYNLLQDSIQKNISNPEIINPMVLQEMWWTRTNYILESVDGDWNNTYKIDANKFSWKEKDFTKSYLDLNIPTLAKNPKFMENIAGKDEFALALFGSIIVDQKNMIDWVQTKAITPGNILSQTSDLSNTENSNISKPESIDENNPEIKRLANWPDENYSENPEFVRYLHHLEDQNQLPYSIMLNLMKQESGGKLYQNWEIIGSTAGARWLFQFMPQTAKSYIVKLWYPESDYQKIFTNPIIWAQACAQYLKECQNKWDTAADMLAHYNAGPNVISGQKITENNFIQLPTETQNYIIKIWYNMLSYNQKPTIIPLQSKPSEISKWDLKQFLTQINDITTTDNLYLA